MEITDQYMEYIHAMEREDLGVMSEFMVMAATLLDIKCKMLLPKEVNEEGEEEDPRAELVEKLLEYKMYKFMSYELKDKMDDAANVFFKEPTLPDEVLQYREPVDPKELLAGLTLEKLNAIYKSIIRRQEDKVDPIRSKFGTIEKEEVSLSDKMIEIKDFARTHRKFSFRNLLESQCSKVQVIVTFLSILELMKWGISMWSRMGCLMISLLKYRQTRIHGRILQNLRKMNHRIQRSICNKRNEED